MFYLLTGNDGIPSKPQTDRSDTEQSNATLEISSHDGHDVHVTRRRPCKDLPNNCLSNSDLGVEFPTGNKDYLVIFEIIKLFQVKFSVKIYIH